MQHNHRKTIELADLPLYLLITVISQLAKDDIINLCQVSKTWYQRIAQKRNIWTNLIRMKYECDTPENYDAMKFYLKPFGNLYFAHITNNKLSRSFSLQLNKIRSVSVAPTHFACLSIDGKLYIWGKTLLNERWLWRSFKYIKKPQFVMSNVKDVKCARLQYKSLEYIIILTTCGDLYVVGQISHDDRNIREPEKYLVSVSSIVSSENDLVVLMFDGTCHKINYFTGIYPCDPVISPHKTSKCQQISLNYDGHDVTNNLKAMSYACGEYYLLRNGKLLNKLDSGIKVVHDNVTMFYPPDSIIHGLLFGTNKSILHSYDIYDKEVEFELDSKITKIRVYKPQGFIYGIYILTENGTLYVHRYIYANAVSTLKDFEKLGLIIDDEFGKFATSPIPVLKHIYDFDISKTNLAVITTKIQNTTLKPHS